MAPQKHSLVDVFTALRALNASSKVTPADVRVGWLLLEHMNKKTGQCDPSIDRMARMLGLSVKTVWRATEHLCELDFFEKQSHGGKSGRASYTPKWDAFATIIDSWRERMKSGDSPATDAENWTKMSSSEEGAESEQLDISVPTTGHFRPSQQDKNVQQTYRKNLFIEPTVLTKASEYDAGSKPDPSSSTRMSQGLLRNEVAAPKPPGYEASERAATSGCSRSDAAWKAAQRRLDAAIASADGAWQSDMWVLTDIADRDQAITAELKRRGDGIACLQSAVRLARLRSGGAGHVH